MPVFDFNNKPDKNSHGKCTYTMVFSNASEASAESPILLLDNKIRQWKHHSCGVFTNPVKRTSFEFEEEDGKISADILQIDARFVSLLRWLGENHITVRLSGQMVMLYTRSVRLPLEVAQNCPLRTDFYSL